MGVLGFGCSVIRSARRFLLGTPPPSPPLVLRYSQPRAQQRWWLPGVTARRRLAHFWGDESDFAVERLHIKRCVASKPDKLAVDHSRSVGLCQAL